MSYQRQQAPGYATTRSSPLRHGSNASTASSIYSSSSNPFAPSRTSTVSSAASSGSRKTSAGHKRGLSETSPTRPSAAGDIGGYDGTPAGSYKSARQSLRPLPQPPGASPPPGLHKSHMGHARGHSIGEPRKSQYSSVASSPTQSRADVSRPQFNSLGRSGSIRPRSMVSNSPNAHGSVIPTSDLSSLEKSSTSHLRNLSRFAQTPDAENFSLSSPAPSVAGLQGRRQLKRTDSTRAGRRNGAHDVGRSAWEERNWMDKQRKFLQAYEYLCHIGEAKEWIEDVTHNPLPPIVQLEEALRNGIALAEIVQALQPGRPMRIFRHPKLQFRHSDNIAMFFDFLADVELPELFRFELIDLYEKKNIPKVIYCIHALSWLLYRKGIVDFRIGNLVGQLEFEHHELEEMQKGLDKAGVSMPSFSGMGASFGAEPEPEPEPEQEPEQEPEPVETEEQRIERELAEHKSTMNDLQAQIRGAVIRIRLGQMMQGLWDAEEWLTDLQSVVRGDWARQVIEYRLSMRRFATNIQSAARGFLIRSRQRRWEGWWQERAQDVVTLQAFVRARRSRIETQHVKMQMRKHDQGIRNFQAAIRGVLQRRLVQETYEETFNAGQSVIGVTAAIRGMLQRRKKNDDQRRLQATQHEVLLLQSTARGLCVRIKQRKQATALQKASITVQNLQAISRGKILRCSIQRTHKELREQSKAFVDIQSFIRGQAQRRRIQDTLSLLSQTSLSVTGLQSICRGHLLRQRQSQDLQALKCKQMEIAHLQSHARGMAIRESVDELRKELLSNIAEIVQLQALGRAMMLRIDVGTLLSQLEDEESGIEALQTAARGKLVRAKFQEKQRFFKANMEKVVKVQSYVRAKLQGEAYKSLTSGKNPPVGTVKGFVHLLNDSDFDFDEEVEFESLRKTVVQHVRQNELADQYITQLDIKIALLVKNKITLDEVVKHQRHFGGDAGRLLTNSEMSSKDPFDLKALNKNSRKKLEHYQELFFVLQTQPQYLARLFRRIREQATAEKECERIRHLMMGVFGYAQKRREEYYLIKLITRSMKEEIEHCHSLQDYLRGNFFWSKIFGAYVKSPRDRKYMRDVMGPIIKENILDNPELDLESDPMQIYLSAIENEQLRTGQRSRRSPDIPREEAIRDEETRRTFIIHLQDLRDIADQCFAALEDQLHKMPFGVRYIVQQMFESLANRFQSDDQGHILQVVGHWLWRSYLQPALVEPEKYGVVDRGLSQEHKRNIGEVARVLGQVALGKLFGGENAFLQPLNSYVGESIQRLGDIWSNLIDVPSAETQFDIDEFNDLYARTKPTLYIKMADIFSIHHLVAGDMPNICPNQDDILREVIRELGSVQNNEHELKHVSNSEICLTLNPKLHDKEDPDAEAKTLFMETKRCVLYIIRVQSGSSLMEIMVKPITLEDEDRWATLVHDELSTNTSRRTRGAYSESTSLIDIASLSYAELKRTALENILRLEQTGHLTRHNHYQDILNEIAVDIRTKHRRRVQRQRELEGVRLTLARLNDQATYLEQQLKTYNDYIEQAMVTLQNKKGKKRFLMPFTKQWDHERELQRSGRVPKFGSFKYSAQELANRGILVAWRGYTERQWAHIDLTISSNEVGVFTLEGSNGPIAIPGASARVPLDDLLQAQFNNTQFLEFFGGGGEVRVNVNLFLHLIMRKFYKDRDS
ncbi:MAG: hypothetical protein LQ338_002100 [Usnochroma carphineum]|nr:MAG: hypothetical protein LQ338_002100 [Usnochroma carphineum]